ncbi:MAG: ATP synthase F1 subunit epsilon [Erysipelotrichaceae bacterium]|nr:ATP synthase F1 subunit epsilon [Erysipelotrichaceae bacterium]MDD3809055.1 ATP synthase F1 subunit epsilon [Erysipelotrichaceae bacterium]
MIKFKLRIVTPRGIYKEIDIDQLNVKTTDGHIGILANHIPLASCLDIAQMNFLIDGKRERFALHGGFVYVADEMTKIITNAIESEDEIDIERANAAYTRAKERLKETKDQYEIQRAEIALKRAITRMNLKNHN